MGTVEPGGFWDGVVNGVANDEEFESILGILDFPMESLEGDGLGDWDSSNSQFLGPIPSDALMGLSPSHPGTIVNALPHTETKPVATLPGDIKETSGPIILHENKFVDVQEFGGFQTQSPVSVLESSGSCLVGKSLPLQAGTVIPVRTRSKRARRPAVNPWFAIPPISSLSKKTPDARKTKERRGRRVSRPSIDMETVVDSTQGSSKSSSLVSDASEKEDTSSQRPAATKKCTHCEVTKTPQWREGPLGPKTLCNACGVRYRSGRLFPEYRPAASPTFVPSLHSNSHKKVIEMRNKATQHGSDKVECSSMSPQPEFVPMSSYLFDYIY